MIQSKVYRGSRYIICMFLLSDALVICCEQTVKTEHISSDVLQMSIRENRVRAQRGEHEERRKRRRARGRRRLRSLCTLTTVGTGRAIDQTRIGRSRIVLLLQGARTWARWLFTRDRLLLPVRRIGVPCYRVMSLLFKNHARVTCAAINYNNVI